MSTTRHTTRSDPATGEREKSGFAVGVIVFAVALMVIQGFMQAFQGVVALADDSFYVVGEEYIFEFDVTSWGWIHVILGRRRRWPARPVPDDGRRLGTRRRRRPGVRSASWRTSCGCPTTRCGA